MDQRLRWRVITLARIAWMVVAALAVTLFVAGMPAEVALLRDPCPTPRCSNGQLPPAGLRALEALGFSPEAFAVYLVTLDTIFAAVCCAVAALVFWRRFDDRMGLLTSLALLTFGSATFVFTLEALATRGPALGLTVDFLHLLGAGSFSLFLYLFPDGRFVPRWTRWVALVWIAWQSTRYFFPDWHLNPEAWYLWTSAVVLSVALGTVVYRYRRVSNAAAADQVGGSRYRIGANGISHDVAGAGRFRPCS